jgi:hypothetical protein
MKFGLKSSLAVAAGAVSVMAIGSGIASANTITPAAAQPQICVQHGPSGTLTSKGNFMLWNWDRQACQTGTYGVGLPAGPKGDTGATGPQGPAGKAPTTTFAQSALKVDSSVWGTLDGAELGAPDGDTASATVRFSCKNATDGCNVSLAASSQVDGWKVYPRLVLEKEDNTTGAKLTCEYADGSDNSGATTALTTTAATVPLGIGSTADCGGSQTGTQPASVNFINVPGATGQGIHYDAFETLVFSKS